MKVRERERQSQEREERERGVITKATKALLRVLHAPNLNRSPLKAWDTWQLWIPIRYNETKLNTFALNELQTDQSTSPYNKKLCRSVGTHCKCYYLQNKLASHQTITLADTSPSPCIADAKFWEWTKCWFSTVFMRETFERFWNENLNRGIK